jgi:hypothetical protein
MGRATENCPVSVNRGMRQYAIHCDDFKVIARQESIGWIWTIEGIVVKYVVLEVNEESAKNAGIDGAKSMLRLPRPLLLRRRPARP